MTAPDLIIDRPAPGLIVLTLNRPAALNALDMALAARLSAALDAAEQDSSARAILLTGAGDRAFSAGFDIAEMAGFSSSAMRDAFVARDPLMLRIAQHRLPVIAALNGLAHGAGALIAAAADFRIAAPTATFKVTAIKYGSANATWSLPRLVGASRAKHILMTGREVGAAEALAIGLFDAVSAEKPVLEAAIALAAQIATNAAEGVEAVKRLVDAGPGRSLAEAWQAEHDHVLASIETGRKGGTQVFDSFLSRRKSG